MKMKIVVLITGALVLFGCGSANLSEAEARRLVEAQPDVAEGVACNLSVIRPVMASASRGQAMTDYFVSRECGEALTAAGLAEVDECEQVATRLSASGSLHSELGCKTHWASARLDGDVLVVPCASLRVVSVERITTEGNTATFTYQRDLVLEPHMAEAAASCGLRLPEPGVASRERTARRDDTGEWSLVAAAQ